MTQNPEIISSTKGSDIPGSPDLEMAESKFELWYTNVFIATLLARKKALLISLILGLIFGFLISFTVPRTYTAELSIIPLKGSSDISVSTSAFEGLAFLSDLLEANMEVGSHSITANKLTAYFKSHWLIREIIEENNLVPQLLNKDNDKFSPKELDRATEVFANRIKIDPFYFRRTDILTVNLVWDSPEIAAINLNRILKKLDLHLRTQAIKRSKSNVEYLNKMLSALKDEDKINKLGLLVLSQYEKIALAQSSENYLFEIIDPPTPKYRPIGPNFIAWAISSSGVFLSLTLIYFLKFKNNHIYLPNKTP